MAGRLCIALKVVERGSRGLIVASESLLAKLQAVDVVVQEKAGGGRRKGLSRYEKGVHRARAAMVAACNEGFSHVARFGALVDEGRHSSGSPNVADVQVLAFKADQYRCYGGYLHYGPVTCFVLVEADDAKQQNKADQAILKRVAKKLAELTLDARRTPLKAGETWPKIDEKEDEG